MTFQDSIRVCFAKYADFNGTASRAEYWWFVLFLVLAGSAVSVLSGDWAAVFFIATVLPLLAVGARRLHDTGRSGWLQLFALVPVAGLVIVAVLMSHAAPVAPEVHDSPLTA